MGTAGGGSGQVIGQAQFVVTANTAQLNQGLQQAQATAAHASEQIGQSLGRGGGASRGLLQLGYAVDDIQYGFRAVVNNIPQIVMGLGGGAGLAGAVGIAAVAINQLVNHWGDLIAGFDGGATKRQAEEMKELADHTEKAAKEYERLAAARVGPGEKAVKATGEAIVGTGAEGLAEGIVAAFAREAGPFRPTREVTVGDQGETRQVELAQDSQEYAEAKAEQLKQLRAAAQALVGDIANNPDARQRVMGMIQANPADFPANAAKNLEESSPARMAEKQIADRKAQEWEGERTATDALNQAKEGAAKKINDDIKERAANKKAGIDKEKKEQDEQGRMIQANYEARKEDEIHALQEKERGLRESAANTPKSQIFEGTRAFVEHNMTAALDKIPNEQLKEAKELNKKIDGLREDLRKQKQAFRLS